MTHEVFIFVVIIAICYFMQFSFEENQTRLAKIVNFIANIILIVSLGYLIGSGVWELWLWELSPL